MRFTIASIVPLMFAGMALAGPTPPTVRSEIDALLGRLEASGCRFGRNEQWYAGADARAHLLRKLEYIENLATVDSTEQFIEYAATKSSVSGAPYMVQCGNATAVQSAPWLQAQLKELRSAKGKPGR